MNSTLLTKDNFNNLCRFCEQPTKASSIQFDKLLKNKQICEQFQEFFGIELQIEVELPSLICSTCSRVLPKYLAFHEKCLNSYYHLKNIRFKEEHEKVEPIKIEAPYFVDIEEEIGDKPELKVEEPTCSPPKIVKELIIPKVKQLKRCPRKKKQCNICGAIVQRLEEHMKLHQTDDLSYICHFCNRKVIAKINLLKHLRSHLNIRDHKCELCAKAFLDSSGLKLHMTVHSGTRNHKCKKCDKAFNARSTLLNHLTRIHDKNHKYICELCDVKFITPSALQTHVNKTHAERPKCRFCPTILKNQRSLEVHERIHTAPEFVCDICKKLCHNAFKLGLHKKCHNNPKGRQHQDYMRKAPYRNTIYMK